LKYCTKPKSRKEICDKIGLTNKDSNFKRYAGEALGYSWLEMTKNQNSSNVKYITTDKGNLLLND